MPPNIFLNEIWGFHHYNTILSLRHSFKEVLILLTGKRGGISTYSQA
jgi:hypothetical protein